MITAIPMNDQRISGHFSKASHLLFINQAGRVVGHYLNPAAQPQCQAKRSLMGLLKRNRVERVIVRNIGQQMLQRLLKQGVTVFQIPAGRRSLDQILSADLNPLTSAEQGRPSENHQNKPGCCHQKHQD